MNAPSIDVAGCAVEPIRTPGAIQPHGWLVAFDPVSHRVAAYSQNCDQLLGLEYGASVTVELQSLLEEVLPVLSDDARYPGPSPAGAIHIAGRAFDLTSHRAGGRRLAEFEPASPQTGIRAPLYAVANHFASAIQAASSMDELLSMAVTEIKRLTQFGRCMAYSFDGDGHGSVLAERADEGYDSYLGHRFPGSDIPSQARDLYVLNRIRLIPNSTYVPVGIQFVDPGLNAHALDLSFAHLRSVSPVHLEYMRNMGTLASMSVSIVVHGRLWGLMSCHNHHAKVLDLQTRIACEHLGRLLSLQIEAMQNSILNKRREDTQRGSVQIISQLGDSDETLQSLIQLDAALLDLAQAEGAAVVFGDECWTTGRVPATEHILALAAWVDERAEVFETDSLTSAQAPFAASLENAAGLLAISLSQVHRHLVIWFRPEIVRSIRWAGDATKQLDAQGRLHPRRSFESWEQIVRGKCPPWKASEIEAAVDLRQALLAIVLDRTQERTAAANRLGHATVALHFAEQNDLAKTHFLAILAHELRTPLASISHAAEILGHPSVRPERAASMLPMIKRNVALASRLVDDLFDLSAISAGKLAIALERVDMHSIVRRVAEALAQDAAAKNLAIVLGLHAANPWVLADPVRMEQVLWNLWRNAIKFTPRGGEIRIETGMRGDDLEIAITDTGIGIDATALRRIFNAFEQGPDDRSKQFGGLGLGLSIAQGIVRSHGGTLEASSAGLDQGATFRISLHTARRTAEELN